MRSLKEMVEIQNYIYLGCDKNTLAEKYGYKNQVTMLKSLEKILDGYGHADFAEITRLQRIEKMAMIDTERDVKFEHLFDNLTKEGMVKKYLNKELFDMTWACFKPTMKDGVITRCNVCPGCVDVNNLAVF